MTVQELKDHLEIMIALGYGRKEIVVEVLPTHEDGYLTTVQPIVGAVLQQTPKGPRVVVR